MLKGHRIIKNYSGGIYDGGGLVEGPSYLYDLMSAGRSRSISILGEAANSVSLFKNTTKVCLQSGICSSWIKEAAKMQKNAVEYMVRTDPPAKHSS